VHIVRVIGSPELVRSLVDIEDLKLRGGGITLEDGRTQLGGYATTEAIEVARGRGVDVEVLVDEQERLARDERMREAAQRALEDAQQREET
jgi:hypothetical protein